MAFNLETALRVVAKVQGLNEFKALTDSLNATGTASRDSKTSLQQLSSESARLTQESTRASGGVRAQTTALQLLNAAQRQAGQETAKTAAAVKGQSAAIQGLTADAEKLSQSSSKVVAGVKGQATALSSLAGASDASAQALQDVKHGSEALSDSVSQLRNNTNDALTGFTESLKQGSGELKKLQAVVQPTDAVLSQLRDELLQVGSASKQTERSIAQQVEALKTLRSQAEINGDVYNQLTADIDQLRAASKGASSAAQEMATTQEAASKAADRGSKTIRSQVQELLRLQTNLGKSGEGYKDIGRQIDALKTKASSLDLSKGLKVAGDIGGAATSGVRSVVQMRRQLMQSMAGRVVLTGEGLATAGLAGAGAAGAGAALGGIAAGVGQLQSGIDAMAKFVSMAPMVGDRMSAPIMESASAIADFAAKITATQAQLADISAPFQAVTHAIQSIGPEAAAAAGVASLAFASIYSVAAPKIKALQNDLKIGYKGISDEMQRMLVETSKIVVSPSFRQSALEDVRKRALQRLGESAPGSDEARRAANSVAVAEREIANIQNEQNQLLDIARQRQNAGTDALKEQVQVARERLDVQRKLTAEVKASAAEAKADRQVAGSVRRYEERLARDAARQERFRQRAAAAFAPSSVLALPAAGQTAFRGAVNAEGIGGGAVIRGAYEVAGTSQRIGAPMAGYSAQARSGLVQQAEAANRVTGSLAKLFMELDRVQKASNGSINSLTRQRAAWDAIRTAVNPAAPAYKNANDAIRRLDEQLQQFKEAPRQASSAFGDLIARIEKLTAENNGSINSLQQLRSAWSQLRDSVNPASSAFSSASAKVKLLDEQLKSLTTSVEKPRGKLAGIYADLERLTKASNGSIGSLQQQRAAWEALRIAVNPAAPAYQKAADQIKVLDERLRALNGTQEQVARRGMGREALGGALGAMATGGGLQSAVGAAAGTLAFSGGPGGLIAGAALTAAGSVAAAAGPIAEFSAQLSGLQTALRGISQSQGEYQRAMNGIESVSKSLNVPISDAVQQFTRLRASMASNGKTVDDTIAVYRNLVTINKALRGDSEKLNGILLATTQVFSKGKVTAEELRGQLGEKLPVAIGDFAASMGVTTAQLDKMLEKGQVTVDDFIEFTKKAVTKYEDTAQRMAKSSEEAGARLTVAWQDFERAIGPVLSNTGAAIQDWAKDVLEAITPAANKLAEIVTRGQKINEAAQQIPAQVEREVAQRFPNAVNSREAKEFARRRYKELTDQFFNQQRNPSPDKPAPNDKDKPAPNDKDKPGGKEDDKRQAAEDRIADTRKQLLERLSDLEQRMIERRSKAEQQLADDRLKLEQQIADALMATRRRAIEAAGGDVGIIDIQQRLIDISRTYQQDIIDAQRQYDEDRKQTEKDIEDYKKDTAQQIANVIEGSAGRAAGIIARVGSTGQSTGPHLDARWADGRPITAADADRYLRINGRAPSSFGVTSPYGPRQMFGRSFHAGVDIGAPAGAGISLQGGATLQRNLGFDPSAGNQLEIMTPQGLMRLLHLQRGAASPTAGGALQAPDLSAVAGQSAAISGVLGQRRDVAMQSAGVKATSDMADALAGITSELNKQKTSTDEQLNNLYQMTQLQRRGLSPAVAEARINAEKLAIEEQGRLVAARETLAVQAANAQAGSIELERAQQGMALIDERLAKQPEVIAQIEAQTAALEAQRSALERNKQISDSIASTIGGGMTDAVNLLFTGTENWNTSLRQIASGVLQSIAKQLIQVLIVEQSISAIRGVLNALSPVPDVDGKVLAKGASAIGKVAGTTKFANGGIVRNPTLFQYADGGTFRNGLMGEAGAEAIMPLRRLPSGRLGVEAAGTGAATAAPITVNVSVDATGSQVQGNAGQGQQLGRAIAIAVRQELANQQRPGGLLAP